MHPLPSADRKTTRSTRSSAATTHYGCVIGERPVIFWAEACEWLSSFFTSGCTRRGALCCRTASSRASRGSTTWGDPSERSISCTGSPVAKATRYYSPPRAWPACSPRPTPAARTTQLPGRPVRRIPTNQQLPTLGEDHSWRAPPRRLDRFHLQALSEVRRCTSIRAILLIGGRLTDAPG